MQELITITEKNGEKAVSARELHQFLGVGRDFSNWIKNRIEEYGFVENQDFEVFAKIGENPNGGRPSKEYAISLDMAKELSMVEKTEKGKLARLYFIEMEKKANKQHTLGCTQEALVIESSTKTYKEQAKEKQRELMSYIRNYLKHGDISLVARQIGRSYDVVKDVLNCCYKNQEITNALYQKALQNKQNLLVDYERMINELKK